jgi:hypothetical protein
VKIKHDVLAEKKQVLEGLRKVRLPFWEHWRELADYFLPRRYMWLLSDAEYKRIKSKNPYILDGTGTGAAKTLASGMMNGITSPARPWFRLRVTGLNDDLDHESRVWLDEVTKRMMLVMAESNFYNAMAVLYMDLVVFSTGAMMIYDDDQSVIHCYNPALGEYYLSQSPQLRVDTFAREFKYSVKQTVELFGIENCSETVKQAYRKGGASLFQDVKIANLIQPNDKRDGQLAASFAYREYFWEIGGTGSPGMETDILSVKGYYDFPVIAPRWEIMGNDAYGTSGPAMDALPDVIQLQHETKLKAQGLDKLVNPPVLADIQLQHKPTALLPRGITFVAGVNNVGVKPIYTVSPPLGEMSQDINDIRARIRETFHNELFMMISQLDTVRSAAEIDARREEKLVLLGPVLERFENEALDPAINRIYAIMERKGLLPEPPAQIANANLEIQYVSILSTAQSAVSAVPTERFLQVIGNISQLVPEAMDIPNFDELLRGYAESIGVRAKDLNSRKTTAALRQTRAQAQDQAAGLAAASTLAQGAKTLSETEVGGGVNALQRFLS